MHDDDSWGNAIPTRIFTDGCAVNGGKKNVGAWAALLEKPNGKRKKIGHAVKSTDSNTMEIRAATKGLKEAKDGSNILLITDRDDIETTLKDAARLKNKDKDPLRHYKDTKWEKLVEAFGRHKHVKVERHSSHGRDAYEEQREVHRHCTRLAEELQMRLSNKKGNSAKR